AQPASQPQADEGPAFDVFEFRIEGNSLLSTIAIERAVYPHLGPGRHINDVEAARRGLEATYRDAGFSTVGVDIPVQRVADGVVVLSVTEGRLDTVRVIGSRYYSQGSILARTQTLAAGEAPYFPELQQELDRLNRSADRRITPVLRAGALPGTTAIDLKVDDRLPLHASAELNNRYSANTTRLRLNGAARYDNFLDRDHSIGLQFQASPQDWDEVKVWLFNYAVPLASGSMYGYVIDSKSNVAAVSNTTVLGQGRIYGLRYAQPLQPRGSLAHAFTAGFDFKHFDEVVTQTGTPGLKTPLDYVPFSLDWSGSVQGTKSRSQFSLGTVFSFRDLSGSDDLEFDAKRFNAKSNFLILRTDLQHERPVFGTYSLLLALSGQIADQPLVSNEQFFAGGAASVRGYLEAEGRGDVGARGSAARRTAVLAA